MDAVSRPAVRDLRRLSQGLRRRIERERWVARRLQDGLAELTMVPTRALVALAGAVDLVVADGVPGALVECGTWRGGASFLMGLRARDRGDPRPLWMFDSFEGLPPPEPEIDGPAALAWAQDTDSPWYFDNCRAAVEDVVASARRLGLAADCHVVKGWFDDSLPAKRAAVRRIALLRIDADWYDSVRVCLSELVPLVSTGGIVVLDDYWTWDGCTRAVHDFLSADKLPYRVMELGGGAAFRVS